jgi:hypothetical protein
MVEPASGQVETWTFTYTLSQTDIDNGLEFYFYINPNGTYGNGSVDNVVITYTP